MACGLDELNKVIAKEHVRGWDSLPVPSCTFSLMFRSAEYIPNVNTAMEEANQQKHNAYVQSHAFGKSPSQIVSTGKKTLCPCIFRQWFQTLTLRTRSIKTRHFPRLIASHLVNYFTNRSRYYLYPNSYIINLRLRVRYVSSTSESGVFSHSSGVYCGLPFPFSSPRSSSSYELH